MVATTAPRVLSCTHEPETVAAARIRRQLRTVLTDWDLAEDTVDDALLVAEELVVNVLDHAHTRFELVVLLSRDTLHIAVRDSCERRPRIRPVNPHAERGRGLHLVTMLSQQWGCDPHRTGKTVWAELRF